jgi:hypothetical protein
MNVLSRHIVVYDFFTNETITRFMSGYPCRGLRQLRGIHHLIPRAVQPNEKQHVKIG